MCHPRNLNSQHILTPTFLNFKCTLWFYKVKFLINFISEIELVCKKIWWICCVKNKLLHVLIAECFLPPPRPDQTQVNHIDHNWSNNLLENLEWCTHQENMKHARTRERKSCAEKLSTLLIRDTKIIFSLKNIRPRT